MTDWDPYAWLTAINQHTADIAQEHRVLELHIEQLSTMVHELTVQIVILESRIEQLEKR
jgi:hypothetical protein